MAFGKISRKDKNKEGAEKLYIGVADGKPYEEGYEKPRKIHKNKKGEITSTGSETKKGRQQKKP